ncbi:unnamed protein product [Adineta steineri]|uniref:Uncharacterized protein n=1 Tax=Adineta steineri TaxID=433720 RepID=A0A813RH96_9BILA|nr:unnamed protein product [Adineta steineri]CAF0808737.1 unnamed protein product [Adineta steineri]CAF0923955.1 unnamed protein product [Adineta steineri]CAF3513810.1 unnamed protein product [Adineta steineri]
MSTLNNYTTRQAASIGLQPGNLIGETHYITESQITPPIKQRIRSKKLLSTNISRCQCCCPPIASSLCRSCLCPCWAYLLIGLLLTLLLAALAVELGFLAREKIINRSIRCTDVLNVTLYLNETGGSTIQPSSTSKSIPECPPTGEIVSSGTSMWASFTYIFFIINLIIYLIKN